MAVNCTFEVLWERLEQARDDYNYLKTQSDLIEVAPTDEEFRKLSIIKKNLESILKNAEQSLYDQWEYDQILESTNELLKTVKGSLYSASFVSSK